MNNGSILTIMGLLLKLYSQSSSGIYLSLGDDCEFSC